MHQPDMEDITFRVETKISESASISSSSSVSSHVIPQWDGTHDDSDAGSDLDHAWMGNTAVGDPSAVRFKVKVQNSLSSPPLPKKVGC